MGVADCTSSNVDADVLFVDLEAVDGQSGFGNLDRISLAFGYTLSSLLLQRFGHGVDDGLLLFTGELLYLSWYFRDSDSLCLVEAHMISLIINLLVLSLLLASTSVDVVCQ